MNIVVNPKTRIIPVEKQSSQQDVWLHPWDSNEMVQWSRKLGISYQQLNDAVIDTGSLNIKDIRNYLREKGVLFSLEKLRQYLTRIIHSSFNTLKQ